MGRNIKPIKLHEGGDAMPSGKTGIIKFYEELISKCKRNKNRTTVYGNVIDDKFIDGLQNRLDELSSRVF
tara:strand:- start:17332 stop:17541 length:210 start_codon:yes stop_codon:yes gene_type:complete